MSTISVTSAPNAQFEISDPDNVFNNELVVSFIITVNRLHTGENSSTDNVSTLFVSADASGAFPKTKISLLSHSSDVDFDASFSVAIIGLNAVNQKLEESHNVVEYLKAPNASTLQNVNIFTSNGEIHATAELADLSFNTNGLKYLVQIDGISSMSGGAYKSRNFVVDASSTNGALYFDSSDYNSEMTSAQEDIVNNAYYDVAVIVYNSSGTFNATGSQVLNVKVSASANPPAVSIVTDSSKNNLSSDGIFTVDISGLHVPNAPDLTYQLDVINNDTSGTVFTTNVDASGTEVVSFDVSGLETNVEYLVKANATNNTNTASGFSVIPALVHPESLPSGLEITGMKKGLDADETAPSGKILVELNKAAYKENGKDVKLQYRVLDVTGASDLATIASDLALVTPVDVSFSDGSYNFPNEDKFMVTVPKNDTNYLIAVYAYNQNESDLSASWIGLNNGYTVDNWFQSETRPKEPQIIDVEPRINEVSDLASGELKVVMTLPNKEDSENVPEYSAYRIFLEKHGDETDIRDTGFVPITGLDISNGYLELANAWYHVDSSNVLIYKKLNEVATEFETDSSMVLLESNKNVAFIDGSGNTNIRTDVSYSVVFSGLTDGDYYKAKAQMRIGPSNESTIVDLSENIVPSTKPSLNASQQNSLGGIFDLTGGFLKGPNGQDITFYKEGLDELLVNSVDGGYDISAVNIVFLYTRVNFNQATGVSTTTYEIHKVFQVNTESAIVDASANGVADLSGALTYDVIAIPQNSVYTDDASYNSFLDVSGAFGSLRLDGIKLSSVIIDLSSSALTVTENGDLALVGEVEEGGAESTEFKRVEYTLKRKIPVWDPVAESFSDNGDEIIESSSFTTKTFSKTFSIPPANYGWTHSIDLQVISKPAGLESGVEYNATAQSKTAVPVIRPTIELDGSAVTIIPNGASVTLQRIELSGNQISDFENEPIGPIKQYNSFDVIGLDPSNVLISDYADVSNNFNINPDTNMQVSAFNTAGRTTLFNENKFQVEVLSGNATAGDANVDGIFTMTVGNQVVTFRLRLAN